MEKRYKVFTELEEITAPYSEVRVLSNGDKIGKYYGSPIEGSLNNEEIIEYINDNHVEENEDEI